MWAVGNKNGVPWSILDEKIQGEKSFSTWETYDIILSTKKILAHSLIKLGEWGLGLSAVDIRSIVSKYSRIQDSKGFQNGYLSNNYFYDFTKRHSNLRNGRKKLRKNAFVNLKKKIQKKRTHLTCAECQVDLENIDWLRCEAAICQNQKIRLS